MTRFDPTLMVRRLVVLQGDHVAYDEEFHRGVNIVCGENSTGKSTIANMLFYVLGGERVKWVAEALQCDWVLAEVSVNDVSVVLRRPISEQDARPMLLFWGSMEVSLAAPFSAWTTYQYAQLGEKDSFSRVLFRAMGLPEVRGILDSQLTMHQLLRLVFVDQKSPQDTIFRTELFDTAVKREAVGEFAIGTLDSRVYDKQETLRAALSMLAEVKGQRHALRSALREAGQDWSMDDLDRADAILAKRRDEIAKKLGDLQARRLSDSQTRNVAKNAINRAVERLRTAKQAVHITRGALEDTKLEIADSDLFISSLKYRADAVSDATDAHAALGPISFAYCPSCYARLEGPNGTGCRLCKHNSAEGETGFHIGRVRQELAQQLKESRSLQQSRRARLRRLEAEQQVQLQQQQNAQRLYDQMTLAATSSGDAALSALSNELGQCDKEAESIVEKREMLTLLNRLDVQAKDLADQVKTLEEEIRTLRSKQDERRSTVYRAIESNAIAILRGDEQEDTFRAAAEVRFDFGADSVHVNQRRNFSDSSLVYLKNTFHLAVLLSSLELDFMRYPRLVIFDNIEDKGMVAERSQAFQAELMGLSDRSETDHQIIYTTSMVADSFRTSDRVVGHFYTKSDKTLRLREGHPSTKDQTKDELESGEAMPLSDPKPRLKDFWSY